MSADSKRARDESKPADAIVPLQEWLKLLAGRGVNMRVAMGLASKMYVFSGSLTQVALCDNQWSQGLG